MWRTILSDSPGLFLLDTFLEWKDGWETTQEMMVKPGLPGWLSGHEMKLAIAFTHELKKLWTDVFDHGYMEVEISESSSS